MASSLVQESTQADNNDNTFTFSWRVSGDVLSSMLSAAPGVEFESDAFEYAGQRWRLEAAPNGCSSDQSDAGSFSLFLRRLDASAGSSLTAWMQLSCDELRSAFSQISSFDAAAACWGWSPCCLHLDELAQSAASAASPSFSFSVQLRVLRLFEDEALRFELDDKLEGGSTLAPLCWTLDEEAMRAVRSARSGKYFVSPLLNGRWLIQMAPRHGDADTLAVSLKLAWFPRNVRSFKVRCSASLKAGELALSRVKSKEFSLGAAETICFKKGAVAFEQLRQSQGPCAIRIQLQLLDVRYREPLATDTATEAAADHGDELPVAAATDVNHEVKSLRAKLKSLGDQNQLYKVELQSVIHMHVEEPFLFGT